jgi:DUF4097 and DUF4098 domain-containing protein YvlB
MTSPRTKTLCSCLAILLVFAGAASAKLSREDARTFPLGAGGRLSLDNVNGDVVIEGWDRDEVSVETVIRAETQASLDEVEVSIDADGDRIHIETVYPERRYEHHRQAAIVDYTIRMPRTARLDSVDLVNGSLSLSGLGGDVKAELVNGRATARDLAGNVELSTVNGSLDVALTELAAGQAIELESVNGSLDLAVPGHADAEVRAETVHGRIRNDFGLEEERDEYVGSSLHGTLGRGGARVELENVNGSINIRQGS